MDPTDITAQTALSVASAQRDARRREVEKVELRKLLSGAVGRQFVMRVIERAGVFRQSFDMSAPESTHVHAFNEGRRCEGLWVLNEILQSCPEQWAVMLRERSERLSREAAEDKQG